MLLLGPPGSGKSDLALRLLERGFDLVADDQVIVEDGFVRCPDVLAGLLEVRGLGVMRLPFLASARLALVAELSPDSTRLPEPARHPALGVPVIQIDPAGASAPARLSLALDCALGRVEQVAGAFVP